jgi:hypothetical protein
MSNHCAGRWKSLSTCASHITVNILFSVLSMYSHKHSPSNTFPEDKTVVMFYTFGTHFIFHFRMINSLSKLGWVAYLPCQRSSFLWWVHSNFCTCNGLLFINFSLSYHKSPELFLLSRSNILCLSVFTPAPFHTLSSLSSNHYIALKFYGSHPTKRDLCDNFCY